VNLRVFLFRAIFPGFLSLLFLAPLPLHARDGSDNGRDYGEGRLLLVPGGWTYTGDTAYAPEVLSDSDPWRSLGGMAAHLADWPGIGEPSRPGLRRYAPGLLFEELACPLPQIAGRLASGAPGSVEFLNFPAGAWWGPSAGAGAIQLQAPSPDPDPKGRVTGWGGNGEGGVGVQYRGTHWASKGDLSRRADPGGGNFWDGAASLYAEFPLGEQWVLGTNDLHANRSGTRWDVFQALAGWNSGNFQQIRIVPYHQEAVDPTLGQQSKEDGIRIDHHFDLAGLFETHWGAGLSETEADSVQLLKREKAGYIRGGFFADVLGRLNLDGMARWDASEGKHPLPSVMMGLRLPLDLWTIEAALHRSAWRRGSLLDGWDDGKTSENAWGIRFQPGEVWVAALRLTRDIAGPERSWGLQPSFTWKNEGPRSLGIRSLQCDLTGDDRWAASPDHTYSGAGQAKGTIGFGRGWSLWALGRWSPDRRTLSAAGIKIEKAQWTLQAEAENLSNLEVAWTEPLGDSGRVFTVSLERAF